MQSILRAIVALAALTLFADPSSAAELVRNGSFAGSMAPWWSQGQGIATVNHDGRSAIAVPGGFVVQEKIQVTGNQRYRLAFSMFDTGTPAGSVFVQMSFRGPGVSTSWAGPALVSFPDRQERAALVSGDGPGRWQDNRSIVFSAPANATELVLYLRKKDGTAGIAYYTAVSLTPTDAPVTTAADIERDALVARRLAPPLPSNEAETALQAQINAAAGPARPHPILAAGLPMRVHVERSEDIITLQAAADLADYIAQIGESPTGTSLSDDLAPAAGPLLIVGRSNRIAATVLQEADFEALGDDGFIIRSYGPHIVIAGKTPRGTMYGVNWFLDHKLGVRWLAPDATFVPKAKDIILASLDEWQVPRFAFREVLNAEAENKAWRQRNLLNGQSHGPSFLPTAPALDSWNETWAANGLIANFYELLPPAKFQSAHPDWYQGGQLAMMNVAMRAEMAKAIIERLRALPDYRSIWFSVHDMDWGWDMDPASAAFARDHGGHPSAPRLDMMIDVANQVRAELPGARLAFNAYHWSFTPPTDMAVPDYLLVYPMTIHVNYAAALNEPANASLGADIGKWNAIASNVLIWDHVTNFGGFIQPTPNILPIGRSIQWLAKLDNVQGYFAEGSFNTKGAEFAALRAWLIARLLWNPDQDIEDLIKDFALHYYGPSAPPVIDYINLMHEAVSQSGDILAEKTPVTMAMFTADFIASSDKLFDEAEALAIDAVHLTRVRAARLPVDYVALMRRHEYAHDAAFGASFSATLAARTQRFWATVAATGVTQYLQGDGIALLRPLLDIERTAAEPPEMISPGMVWFDIQDLQFNRYAGAKSAIVADPLASDGAAIALDRSATGWNAQLKLDQLPRQDEWWVYMSVRTGTAISDQGQRVARIGSAPPMGCYVTVTGKDLDATSYKWVEVPGGPFSFSTDHAQSLYVQPEAATQGQTILLDRAIAVGSRLADGHTGIPDGDC